MDDDYEIAHGFNEWDPSDAEEDSDGDGLSNLLESKMNLDPMSGDSDGDGLADGLEDSDQDGLSNSDEVVLHGTDPSTPDTDDDGMSDGDELSWYVQSPTNGGRYLTSPLDSRSPLIQKSMVMDGTRTVIPAESSNAVDRFVMTDWSLEGWVRLTTNAQDRRIDW